MRASKPTATSAPTRRRFPQAIAKCRELRKLLREREEHTKRLIDAAEPKPPKTCPFRLSADGAAGQRKLRVLAARQVPNVGRVAK